MKQTTEAQGKNGHRGRDLSGRIGVDIILQHLFVSIVSIQFGKGMINRSSPHRQAGVISAPASR